MFGEAGGGGLFGDDNDDDSWMAASTTKSTRSTGEKIVFSHSVTCSYKRKGEYVDQEYVCSITDGSHKPHNRGSQSVGENPFYSSCGIQHLRMQSYLYVLMLCVRLLNCSI